nr:retrovirus-related Pol polyprotein from transposon TNT 1-94 [Tanacetum cinerariifolium]
YQSNPKESHLTAVKRILKFLKGACQILGGKLVCWSAKKQQSMAMSSVEVEYVAVASDQRQTLNCDHLSTVVAYDLFPSADETKNAHSENSSLNHPTPEAVKKELVKIAINPSYLDKTPFLKNSFHVAWRILFTFVIQDKNFGFLPSILSNSNFTKDPSKVTDIELTAHVIAVNNQRDSVSPLSLFAKPKKGKSQTVTPTLPKLQVPEAFGALFKKRQNPKSKKPPTETNRDIHLFSTGLPFTLDEGTRKSQPLPEGKATHTKDSGGNIPPTDREPIHTIVAELSGTGVKYQVVETYFTRLSPDLKRFDNTLPLTEIQLIKYLKKMSRVLFKYYDDNVAHGDQTDKLVKLTMSIIDKSSMAIQDLYKGLNVITQLLKDINNDSTMKDLQAQALKQEEASVAYDTLEIKSMMRKIYQAFKGQSFLAPSSSVTLTLALTNILANVERENVTNTATEEPPSHTEGETEDSTMKIPISSIQPTEVPPTQAQPITLITTHLESSQAALRIYKGEGIAIKSDEGPLKKLVPASTTIRPDPDEEEKVPHTINGKMCYHTNKEIQAYLDKEEKLGKAVKEARLLAISKPERKHIELELEVKVHGLECNKSLPEGVPFVNIWSSKSLNIGSSSRMYLVIRHLKDGMISTRLREDKIQESEARSIRIPDRLSTPMVIFVLSFVIDDKILLKKFSKELRIQSALPAPVSKQASSLTSGRKRKHIELELEVKVHGLECNKSLPEGVPFVNIWSLKSLNIGSSSRMYLVIRYFKDGMISTRPREDKIQESEARSIRIPDRLSTPMVIFVLSFVIDDRILERVMRSRCPKMLRVELFPADPLISYGLLTLKWVTENDIRNSNNLVAAQNELLQTIHEKEELIGVYRAM